MLYSGVILELHSTYAYVMTNDLGFLKIKISDDNNLKKGQILYFVSEDILIEITTQKKSSNFIKIATSIAAIFIFTILGIYSFQFFTQPKIYAYIDFDADSSVEFSINDKFEVISVKGFNQKGNEILKKLNLIDSNINKALLEYYNTSINYGSLDTTSKNIFITSVLIIDNTNKDVLEKEIENLANKLNSTNPQKSNIKIAIFDKTIKHAANEHNMSMGRYVLYTSANEGNTGISFKNITNYTIDNSIETVGMKNLDQLLSNPTEKVLEKTNIILTPTPKPSISDQHTITSDGVFKITKRTTIIEAEDALITNKTLNNSFPNFTGIGYVSGFKGLNKSIEWNFDIENECQYDIWIRYKCMNYPKDMEIHLNNFYINDSIGFLKNTYSWDYVDQEINFNKGINSLKLVSKDNKNDVFIDHIKLIKVD